MKAIYNLIQFVCVFVCTVFSITKIQFWKQFTTARAALTTLGKLYSVLQRYNFESNLQRARSSPWPWRNCIQYYKDTILKAIYNYFHAIRPAKRTVFSITKIQFWKQFTTFVILYDIAVYCIQYYKDTILKAIYNGFEDLISCLITVFSITKIQFWKQFTTIHYDVGLTQKLYSVLQRYNFESNLQRNVTRHIFYIHCIQYYKDTILKAIYNGYIDRGQDMTTVFSITKIQFWKQFTTVWQHWLRLMVLYSVLQRYNFESNLQPMTGRVEIANYCIQYYKDTILKAIYNHAGNLLRFLKTVFSITKIQFWKQFTTFMAFIFYALNCIQYYKALVSR